MQYTIKFYKCPTAKMNVRQAVSEMFSQGWSIFTEVDGFIEDYGNAIGWYDIVQPLKSPNNSEKVCIASIDTNTAILCINISKLIADVNRFLSLGYILGTPCLKTSRCEKKTYPIGFIVLTKE